MGRPRKTTDLEIEYLKQLFLSKTVVRDGKILPKTNQVWEQLSYASKSRWTPLSLFTIVSKNYYNIHDVLGLNIPPEPIISMTNEALLDESSDTNFSSCSSNESNTSTNSKTKVHFTIILFAQEYLNLGLHEQVYQRNDEKNNPDRKSKTRNYLTFEKQNWTRQLYDKVDSKLKSLEIPCTVIFKRCKLYKDSLANFAVMEGKCRECSASVICRIPKRPTAGEDVEIYIEIEKHNAQHQLSTRRWVTGSQRVNLGKHMAECNVTPSTLRRKLAATSDDPGRIPKLGTIKQIKHQFTKARRPDQDPIIAVWKMKIDPNMKGAIQNIGLDPFFVYLWTNTQVHVYNRFCNMEYAKICIDATGSVVKKVKNPFGEKSNHIFLYDITVRSLLSKSDNQYSVCNMLSASQNAVSIYSWLAHWKRAGASNPQEVVMDMSIALIYAAVLAFTKFKSLKEYLTHCYKAIFEKQVFQETCYIRNDVAHFVKVISQWPSLNKQHRLTRQFYLRSMGQIIQCTDVTDMENLFKAIFTVAFSDTEGQNANMEDTECEICKNWLIRRCSTGSIENIESLLQIPYVSSNTLNVPMLEELPTEGSAGNEFHEWIADIAKKCEESVNRGDQVGNRGNQQCLPKIKADIMKSAKLLPLWSAILKSKFPMAPLIASSAPVESNFNNIKHRIFSNKDLPIRVDDFLDIFIRANEGQINLVKTNMETTENAILTEETPQNSYSDKSFDPFDKSISGEFIVDRQNSLTHPVHTRKRGTTEIVLEENPPFASGVANNSVVCPSCQLRQPRDYICQNCSDLIHQNAYCSKELDGLLFCLRCSSIEQATVENWHGQATQTKKRPRKSYLEPSSDLFHAEYSKRIVLPIGLLKNGNIVDLKPIRISNDVSLTLSNTCGFDSLLQLLASAYCDSYAFKFLIDLHQSICETASIILNLVKEGVTKKTYKKRAVLLYKIFDAEEHPNKIFRLNTECVLSSLLSKLDLSKCFIDELHCYSCKFSSASFRQSIEVELQTAEQLEGAIIKKLSNNILRKCSTTNCDGFLQNTTNVSWTHFFVEPVDIGNRTLELKCSLNEIPKCIEYNRIKYILRGVVGYVGPDNSLGHFISYCYRHNNLWEEYDDRQSKPSPCSPLKNIRIQIILYTS